jgi:hypothetical protein
MRRTKSRTLETEKGNIEIKVFEVRPLDLLEIHKEIQRDGLPVGEYERLLPLCCNLTKDQIVNLYPSEMAVLLDDFREVNADFFAPWPTIRKVIEKVGLVEWGIDLLQKSGMMEKMKTAISLDLQKLCATLPALDTLDPSATDGGTSPLPSSSPKNSPSKKETSTSEEDSPLH